MPRFKTQPQPTNPSSRHRWCTNVAGLPFADWGWVLAIGLSLWCAVPSIAQQNSEANFVVKVSPFVGDSITGSLISADATAVVLQVDNKPVEKKGGDISLVAFSNKSQSPSTKSPIEVSMIDGSKVFVESIAGKSVGYQLRFAGGSEVAVPGKTIKAARVKPLVGDQEVAWLRAIQETKDSDALIVIRPGNQMDRINGVIVEVREAEVVFELDGQQINVPMIKLVGMVWFQRVLERVKPTVEISTTDESTWMAESFSLAKGVMELQSLAGVKVSLPAKNLMRLNYGSANLRWLSDLEVLEAVADKQIDFKTPVPSLELSMTPRFLVNGKMPTTATQSMDKDLCFPSPGRFVFRVPEGFSVFQSTVQRTDRGNVRTDLKIEVWQEDQKISELPLEVSQDSVEINVPVPAGKKIKLVVACASKLMIGTEVQWKQPRLKR